MSAVAKIAHIRNPLTIIAMFAVIAEVSGTIVLPLLDSSVQHIYVWFLMLFPTILVGLFFYTLHRKRDALYGPGDYNDEKNFMDLIRPASTAELVLKSMADIEDASSAQADEATSEKIQPETPPNPAAPGGAAKDSSITASPPDVTEEGIRRGFRDALIRSLTETDKMVSNSQVFQKMKMDKDRALASLESTYGPIRPDMMVMGEVVDGLGGTPENPVVIETVHYSPQVSMTKLARDASNVIAAAKKLKSERTQGITAVLVLITEKRYESEARDRAKAISQTYPPSSEIQLHGLVFVVEDRARFFGHLGPTIP